MEKFIRLYALIINCAISEKPKRTELKISYHAFFFENSMIDFVYSRDIGPRGVHTHRPRWSVKQL